ncbi:hypothetical protein DRO31_01785 [Candidatus Bathyarchaeota archaeon]|nr:MAG: hypothetical protein DRO31_01785 [Candidatus Bathyarchaeota archaeon]
MSYLNIFLELSLRYKLAIVGIALIIIGSIMASIGKNRGGKGKACAWCGREIQGKEVKCSMCKDKFCSQKCMIEHKNAMHAPRY